MDFYQGGEGTYEQQFTVFIYLQTDSYCTSLSFLWCVGV